VSVFIRPLHNSVHTNAFQVRLDVGNAEINYANDWNLLLAYRYLERDALLDAFTDTIFHQGGTDAKGWMVGGSYGVAKNTSLMLRWFTTEAIDGPPLDINTLTMDLTMRL